MEFRMTEHLVAPSSSPQAVIEVWNGGACVATIYPTGDGVRVVSEGLAAIDRNFDGAPAVTVILR